jgi:hypothetical protein
LCQSSWADEAPSLEDSAPPVAEAAIVARPAAPPPVYAPPPEPDPVYRRTFVGRDTELDTLRKAFDQASAGHGSLAMVGGEPGIGKTSICEQLAGYVAQAGGKTPVGHCYEEGSLSCRTSPSWRRSAHTSSHCPWTTSARSLAPGPPSSPACCPSCVRC